MELATFQWGEHRLEDGKLLCSSVHTSSWSLPVRTGTSASTGRSRSSVQTNHCWTPSPGEISRNATRTAPRESKLERRGRGTKTTRSATLNRERSSKRFYSHSSHYTLLGGNMRPPYTGWAHIASCFRMLEWGSRHPLWFSAGAARSLPTPPCMTP